MSESDWTLLARYLSGECSEAEQAEVETLIASDPEKKRLIASMSGVWDTPDPHAKASDVSQLWGEIARKAGIATGQSTSPLDNDPRGNPRGLVVWVTEWFQPQRWRPARGYAVAAALLIACSLTYYWSQEKVVSTPGGHVAEWTTVAVESGAHGSFTLRDGSQVRLDAGSALRHPEAFGADERTVFLSGEGYFEVAPEAGRPFVVHAEDAVVEVLGTEFNVRAWDKERRVTVAVAEGKVALGAEGDARATVEIEMGQMSTLPESGQPSEPRQVDIDRHLAWMQREAFFDNAPLHEVLHQLERWYSVQFVLEDTSMASEQLTLHIQSQSLVDVLELVSGLTGLEYERTDGAVRLWSRDPHR